jgi:hypothetical protein
MLVNARFIGFGQRGERVSVHALGEFFTEGVGRCCLELPEMSSRPPDAMAYPRFGVECVDDGETIGHNWLPVPE